MKIFTAKHKVIIDLHERGYCEDFKLAGNDIFWLQEKQIVRAGDFLFQSVTVFLELRVRITGL
jgi:hypothetical protein